MRTVSVVAAAVGLFGTLGADAGGRLPTVARDEWAATPVVVSISGMTYDGAYTPTQAVRVYRGIPANIVVTGTNLHFATASQLVTTGGAPAPGMTATIAVRSTNRITILVTSTGGAAFGDYTMRIRYAAETNGPDVFRVRLFQRGTITSLRVEGVSDPTRLAVGTQYTLVATGTNLDRVDCCGAGQDKEEFSLEPISRSATTARFALVMKRGFPANVRSTHFHDGNLPAPEACGLACYAGSATLTFAGIVAPRITAASPRAAPANAEVTLSGTRLAPVGWSTQLLYLEKYRDAYGSMRKTQLVTGTNTALRFAAPANLLPDSLILLYHTPSSGEQLVDTRLPVPSIFVTRPPAIVAAGTVVTGGGTPADVLRPGTMTIFGEHLLSAPTSATTSTLTTTTATRDGSTATLVPVGSPLPPTVSFNSTPLPVQSAIYEYNRPQPGLTRYGVDRVTVTVPDLGTNQAGTLTVTTTAGTATRSNVIFATAPRVTRVEEAGNPAASGSSNQTLYRGAQYIVTGSAFQIMKPLVPNVIFQGPTVKINGVTVPATTVVVTDGGTRLRFTVPTTAASGALTIETAGGVGSAGNFTVANAPVAPSIAGAVIAPNPVVGGTATVVTVAFAGTIPTDGSAGQIVVTIPQADQTVVAPSPSISILANPVTFPITTRPVATARTVPVTIGLSAANSTTSARTVSLVVNPPKPTSLILAAAVTGGQPVTGRVEIDAAISGSSSIPVALSSSDPTTVSVPATVTVSGGRVAQFTATTVPVTARRTVTVTASIAGVSVATTVNVDPPALGALTLPVTRITSGRNTTGTVTFTAPVTGASVQLSSSDTSVKVQSTATASGTSVTVNVRTLPVGEARTATISATMAGVTKTATLTVDPLVVQSIVVSPLTVSAGGTATVTIRLNAPSVGSQRVSMAVSDTSAAKVSGDGIFAEGQDVTVVSLTAKSPIVAPKVVTLTGRLSQVVPVSSFNSQPLIGPASTASATATVTP
jgi:hypothetical protein